MLQAAARYVTARRRALWGPSSERLALLGCALLGRPLLRGRLLLRSALARRRLSGCRLACRALLGRRLLLRRGPLLGRLPGTRRCLLRRTHVAAFRQRLALRVAVAFEGDVLFDEAFRAGAALFPTVPPLLFRNSFHEELAENLTALEAAILTAAPVRGLRPVRAVRGVP